MVGILLLCPLFAWSLTGLIFLIQPGYGAAYEALGVKTYPLDTPIEIPANPQWQEARLLKTALGTHLLVRAVDGNLHFDAFTKAPFPPPDDTQIQRLIGDAIAGKAARYGELAAIEGDKITTTSGIEIQLYWETLGLRQYGNDTRWIDRLYSLHYLQWTGIDAIDKALGIAGLVLLWLVSITGFKMLRQPISKKPDPRSR